MFKKIFNSILGGGHTPNQKNFSKINWKGNFPEKENIIKSFKLLINEGFNDSNYGFLTREEKANWNKVIEKISKGINVTAEEVPEIHNEQSKKRIANWITYFWADLSFPFSVNDLRPIYIYSTDTDLYFPKKIYKMFDEAGYESKVESLNLIAQKSKSSTWQDLVFYAAGNIILYKNDKILAEDAFVIPKAITAFNYQGNLGMVTFDNKRMMFVKPQIIQHFLGFQRSRLDFPIDIKYLAEASKKGGNWESIHF